MKSTIILLTSGLLATQAHALAIPSLRSLLHHRRQTTTGNWAGSLYNNPPEGTTWQSVHAKFAIPDPKLPDGSGDDDHSGAAWVGIDGTNGLPALWQAGCSWTLSTSTATKYNCWWEWVPGPMQNFDGFVPSAGDVVEVTLNMDSATQGSVTINNLNSGQTASQTVQAPDPSSIITGTSAEFILEDLNVNGSEAPMADFGTVTFTECTATAADGTQWGVDHGEVLNIEQNGNAPLTSTQYSDSNTMQVSYE